MLERVYFWDAPRLFDGRYVKPFDAGVGKKMSAAGCLKGAIERVLQRGISRDIIRKRQV